MVTKRLNSIVGKGKMNDVFVELNSMGMVKASSKHIGGGVFVYVYELASFGATIELDEWRGGYKVDVTLAEGDWKRLRAELKAKSLVR